MADAATPPGTPGRATVDARNPWPGLEAFGEADAGFFFGREGPSAELTQLIIQQRLVVLYGRSGLGKTSLLQAGVFPKLREARLLPVYVRVDFRALNESSDAATLRSQVKTAIESAAAKARVDAPALDPGATLWEWFYRTDARFWNERSRRLQPVLVFDQFEEAFTHGRRSDATSALTSQLLSEVVDVVRGSVPPSVAARLEQQASEALAFSTDRDVCHVLLSLRKEFLPELLRLRPRLPTLLDHRLELRGMTHADAARVVLGPGGDLVEEGVDGLIVDFVARARRSVGDQSGDEAMVDPAILSVFCRELNRRRRASGLAKINAALLEGTRDTIIAEFYGESVRDLGPDVQRFIEDHLITESGYRNSVALEQAQLKPGVTPEVIERLIDRRLLRSEGAGPEARLELTHDVLADPIMARRNTRREGEREEEERRRAEALRQEAQAEAERAQRERELQMARELLETKRRATRRQNWLLAGLAVLLVIATAMSLNSLAASREARSNLATAYVEQARGLIAAERRDQGLAYVAQALRVDPGHVAARSLAIDTILHANWPLPTARLAHEGRVLWAEFNPASSRVVTASQDRTARLWSVPDGREIGVPLPHDGAVFLARFAADGSGLLTVASDGFARLWDVDTGREVQRYDHPNAAVVWAEFAPPPASAPGTPIVVTGATDGTVRTWTGAAPRGFKAHDARLVTVQGSPDGAYLLTASADDTAVLWDARTDSRLATLHHNDDVTAAQFSASGAFVATASRDGTAKVWASPGGRLLFTLQHPAAVSSAQFSPDGTRLLTVCDDGVARLWDTSNGLTVGVPMVHPGLVSAFFAALGDRVITASSDQTARIWDVTYGRALGEPMRHPAALQSAVISRDMQFVAAASDDGAAWLWDVRLGSAVPSTLWLSESPTAVAFGPDGQSVVLQAWDGTWATWDGTIAEPRALFDERSGITAIEVSRDGSRVLQVTAQGVSVSRWPGAGPAVALPEPDAVVAAFSPDGRFVATGTATGSARTWRADDGTKVGETTHDSEVRHVEFSADGSLVLSRAADGTARIWKAQSGQTVREIKERDPIAAIRFDGGAALVVTTPGDRDVLQAAALKDLATGRVLARLAQDAPMLGAAFSPDGRTLVTLSESGKVRLWEASTGQPIATLADDSRALTAEFSRDGLRLVTGSASGSVRVWDARSGQPYTAPLGAGPAIDVVRFAADGQRVLGESTAGTIRVWEVPTGEPEDARTLPPLIEALTGYRVNQLGAQSQVQDRLERLAVERTGAGTGPPASLAGRLRTWALGSRTDRTIGPFTSVTIDEFVRGQPPGSDGFREASEWFPWHPAFRPSAIEESSRAAAK